MSTKSKKEISAEIEAELSQLTVVDSELTAAEVRLETEIKKIKDKHSPKIDELSEKRSQAIDTIVELWENNRDTLQDGDSKTIKFRSGTLSVKFTAGSLTIEDESVVMKYLRRKGKLRAYTRAGKRTIDKRALKNDPEFVDKAPGMHISRPEVLTIGLAKTQTEIVETLNPFKRTV